MLSALFLRWNCTGNTQKKKEARWRQTKKKNTTRCGHPIWLGFGRQNISRHIAQPSEHRTDKECLFLIFVLLSIEWKRTLVTGPKYLCATNIKILQMLSKKRSSKERMSGWRLARVGAPGNKSENGKHVVRWPWRQRYSWDGVIVFCYGDVERTLA